MHRILMFGAWIIRTHGTCHPSAHQNYHADVDSEKSGGQSSRELWVSPSC